MRWKNFFNWTFLVGGTLLVMELCASVTIALLQQSSKWQEFSQYVLPEERVTALRPRFDAALGWTSGYSGPRPVAHVHPSTLLAVFGDSFALGGKRPWPEQLANKLRANVLNFGVGGYGTGQAYLRFQKEFRKHKTPIVVLELIPENLVRMWNSYRPLYNPATGLPYTKPRFVLKDKKLALIPNPIEREEDLIRLSDSEFILGLAKEDPLFQVKRALRRVPRPHLSFLFEPTTWMALFSRTSLSKQRLSHQDYQMAIWEKKGARRLLFSVLRSFARKAEAWGAKPIIALLPAKSDAVAMIKKDRRFLRPRGWVGDFCSRNQILFFDGFQAVQSHIRKPKDLRRYYRGPNDGHFNPQGEDLIAEAFYEFLQPHLL